MWHLEIPGPIRDLASKGDMEAGLERQGGMLEPAGGGAGGGGLGVTVYKEGWGQMSREEKGEVQRLSSCHQVLPCYLECLQSIIKTFSFWFKKFT